MQRGRRQPLRGVSRGFIPRGRGGSQIKLNNRIEFRDSSSDYDSYTDDLPVIKRKISDCKSIYIETSDENSESSESQQKTKANAELISDYDYFDDYEADVEVITKSQKIENIQTQKNEKENNKEKANSQSENNNNKKVTENLEDNQNKANKSNISKESHDLERVNHQTEDSITQREELERIENESQDEIVVSQNEENTDLIVSENEELQSPINLLDNDCNLPSYKIVWNTGSIHSKSHFKLILNENVIFHSKEKKTKIGNFFVICSDKNIDLYSKSYQGSLKISQNSTRYTLFAPKNEQFQEGEIMGFSFYEQKEINFFGIRAFRIALPKRHPYLPLTKDMNLSKIAQKNVQSDEIQIFSSKLPELCDGSKLKLTFGNVHVIPSVKNFILEDGNGNAIFMIYKSSDRMCTMRIAPPITPLIAFALSIAVIKSNK